MRVAVLAGWCAMLAAPAAATQVFKQADGEGRVTYADRALPDKRVIRTMDLPRASDAERAEIEVRRQAIAGEAEALRERLRQRSAALDRNALEIRLASRMLGEAQRALESGLAPQPGERTGRRFNDAYFTRIAGLEQRLVDARARLDRAYAERDDFR
ncbi:MAG: DUF4124 domain-containing protein [Burkholderiales bacterium]|nr:DUF4124 domain-containing protein [Burkholderiales bacterium]